MKTRVIDTIDKYNMIKDNDVIVVGVSGGPDSVCLLFLLNEIIKNYKNVVLEVVHVNHMIRKTASRDEEFVRDLCDKLGISLHIATAGVTKMAKDMGLSTEEAGRIVRYDAFNKVLGKRQGKIAVAHNANDVAETMLFNLFRGTDIKGLVGIYPVNNNIIRPLIEIPRKDIEEYLGTNGIEYVLDETNETDDYTRNKIRHHIVEYADKDILPNAVDNMIKASERFSMAEAFLEESAYLCANDALTEVTPTSFSYDIDVLLTKHPYMIKRVIYDGICTIAGSKKDITESHVEAVVGILNRKGSKEVHLPYNVVALKEYKSLTIKQNLEEIEDEAPIIKKRILENFDLKSIPCGNYTKWFDYDKIANALSVRKREKGDYVTINSHMDRQLLQDYMVNSKIPKNLREKVWLLADGNHIVWVIGYRISEYYKVTKDTKKVLEITIEEND